jgi:cytochrome bd-type quinol oxidase subunit 2
MDSVHKLINTTEKWLNFAPKFSKKFSDWLAKYLWVFTLVGAVGVVFLIYTLLSASKTQDIFAYEFEKQYYGSTIVFLAGYAVQAVVLALAVQPLRHGKKHGWELLYISVIISALTSIISTVVFRANHSEYLAMVWDIFWHVISYFFSAYLLFQTRSHFVKK